MNDNLPYQLALNIYHQGMECDAAARNIRLTLPGYLKMIKDMTKSDMDIQYDSSKEREWASTTTSNPLR